MVYLILLVKTIPVKKDARLLAGRHHITCRPIKACISCLMRREMAIYRLISPKYSAGKIFKWAVSKIQPSGNNNPQAVISEHASEIMEARVKTPLYLVGIINQPVGMTICRVGMANQSVGMTNRQVGIINQPVGMTN